jgi:predicted KAP-like P-loop ATPase
MLSSVRWRRKRSRDQKGEEPKPSEDEAPSADPDPEKRAGAHSADEPIAKFSDDLLRRKEFALALATDVRLAPRESGFVIGLSGEWGAGKTSVLQLVAEALDDELSATVSFNPWLFSGTEQLVTYFFAELASQLEETGSEQLSRVAGAFSAYGKVVSPLRYLPFAGDLFKLTGEAAKSLGTALEPRDPSAREQAERLKLQLALLRRPILVLVDDLDRLSPQEIVDVVRLVRLIGDFPNLVYLVAFDREVVESALNEERGGDGHAYLEKIIHISHSLPPVRSEDLTAVLQVVLAEVIPRPSDYRFDRERFESLFWGEVRPLFTNVRDIRRFANLLRTTLELIGDEVDLADVLALEALRLFEPEAFKALLAARYPLTGATPPSLSIAGLADLIADEEDETGREQVRRIPAAAKSPDAVSQIVRRLFPRAERYLEGAQYHTEVSTGLKAARRAGDIEVFDVYLHRRIAPGDIPSREVEKALDLLQDKGSLEAHLQALPDDKVRSLYSRLAEYEGRFSPEAAGPAIEAILHRNVGFSDSFTDMSGFMLIRGLLEAVPAADLAGLLQVLDYPNLSRRGQLLRSATYRDDQGRAMLPQADAQALTGELVGKVLASSAEELGAEEDLASLIALADRHDGDRLRKRLPSWLLDDTFFVRFLAGHSMSKITERDGRTIQLNWRGLTDLIPEPKLGDRLKKIDPEWVERSFGEDTWILWRQALRYLDDPQRAREDLVGWPSARSSGEDERRDAH